LNGIVLGWIYYFFSSTWENKVPQSVCTTWSLQILWSLPSMLTLIYLQELEHLSHLYWLMTFNNYHRIMKYYVKMATEGIATLFMFKEMFDSESKRNILLENNLINISFKTCSETQCMKGFLTLERLRNYMHVHCLYPTSLFYNFCHYENYHVNMSFLLQYLHLSASHWRLFSTSNKVSLLDVRASLNNSNCEKIK
jgi:hypothetical protein